MQEEKISERRYCRIGILMENISALRERKSMGIQWSLFQSCPFPHSGPSSVGLLLHLEQSPNPPLPHSTLPICAPLPPEDLRQHITTKTWFPMSCHSHQLASYQCLTSLLFIFPWHISKKALLNYSSVLSSPVYLLRVK